MDVRCLTKDPTTHFPIDNPNNLGTSSLLKSKFKHYLDLVSRLEGGETERGIKRNYEKIKEACDLIIKGIDSTLDGNLENGFEHFKTMTKVLAEEIKGLQSEKLDQRGLRTIYRIRIRQYDKKPSRQDMFHIPFEQRFKASTRRFSVPGLPCLYAAKSTYSCWFEMGCPEFSKIWVSRIQLADNKKIRILDLGWHPEKYLDLALNITNINDKFSQFMTYLYTIWPLKAACSIRRNDYELHPFVEEYIIPQMLMRWLMFSQEDDSYTGVRYFSTRITDKGINEMGYTFAFPARPSDPSRTHSNLETLFQISDPVYWPHAISVNPTTNPPDMVRDQIQDFGVPDGGMNTIIEYHYTDFARIESVLRGMPLSPI